MIRRNLHLPFFLRIEVVSDFIAHWFNHIRFHYWKGKKRIYLSVGDSEKILLDDRSTCP